MFLHSPLLLSIAFLLPIPKFKTIFSTFQRIFSWNSSKCEKKCCFLEEHPDFIFNQISEFLSDFAHFEIWWRWNFVFLGETEKKRFWAFWALNNLQIAKMPQKFPWAIIPSVAYLKSKMSEILIFSNFSKNQLSVLIILQNGQIPTETRSCGSNWNLSADCDFSHFSRMKKNLGDMRMDLVGICKMSGKNQFFFRAKIDIVKSPEINFYHFLTTLSRLISCHQIWRK